MQGLNVIAYATYCQTDQFGRPVAGSINICPQLLKDPDFNEEKVSKVAVKLHVFDASFILWYCTKGFVLNPFDRNAGLPLAVRLISEGHPVSQNWTQHLQQMNAQAVAMIRG